MKTRFPTLAAGVMAAGLAAALTVPAFAQTAAPGAPAQVAPTQPGATTAPGATPNTNRTTPGMGTGTGTGMTGTDTTGALGGLFYSTPVGANQWRASSLIGQSVYNRANERIGEVNELVVERDGRLSAVILGVGGFLGIGERDVAVNFSSVQMTTNNNEMRLVVDVDRNRLRDAPEFRRPDSWRQTN